MTLTWRRTPLPSARSRTDDIWFHDDLLGWAVNSDGKVFRTEDGATTWSEQHLFASSYLRCVSFSSPIRGWIGALSGPHPLYGTNDGGNTWIPVDGLPVDGPGRICGLIAVSDEVIFASGTNYPDETAGVIRSTDGGATWHKLDLGLDPALLVDVHFQDAQTGWVVGGIDAVRHPDRATERRDVVPMVLHTTDGGESWSNVIAENLDAGDFPQGEWGWKIQRLGAQTILVSLENFYDGAIIRSDDLGATWTRLRINDRQRNSNLEGVGFVNSNRGWVGGWGDRDFIGGFTSETNDGGRTWDDANHVGFRLNRFRFIGDPVRVGYASGDTVYKLSEEPVPSIAAVEPEADLSGDVEVAIDLDVPDGAGRLDVRIWERFGREVRHLVAEDKPAPGPRKLTWNFADDGGADCGRNSFIVRVVTDASAFSRVVHRVPKA